MQNNVVKGTSPPNRIRPRLLADQISRELHEIVGQLFALRERATALRRGRCAYPLPGFRRLGHSKHSRHGTLELVLLKRLHEMRHAVTQCRVPASPKSQSVRAVKRCTRTHTQVPPIWLANRGMPACAELVRLGAVQENSRLMDVLGTLLRAHDTGVRRVHDDVRMSVFGDVTVKVSSVQDTGQLAATVLPVGSDVPVDLVEAGELCVARGAVVHVARLVADADDVALLGCLLHQRQQMAGQNYMAHVVDGHVSIDAIVGQLGCHDAPAAVVDQDIEPVRLALDDLGHLLHAPPVAQVAFKPYCSVRLVLAQLLCEGFLGAFLDFLVRREDEQLGDVVLEERVGDAIADALRAAGDDGYLAREIGAFFEGELVCAQFGHGSTEVFGEGVLHTRASAKLRQPALSEPCLDCLHNWDFCQKYSARRYRALRRIRAKTWHLGKRYDCNSHFS